MIDKPQKVDPSRSSDLDSMDKPSGSWRISMRSPHWRPPTDVFESEEKFTVRVEIPGMREQDFFIELNGRELTIRGNRQDTSERRAFHQMEIRFGEFAFFIEIPAHIAADKVEASYQNGFLTVCLPKTKPQMIQIMDNNEPKD